MGSLDRINALAYEAALNLAASSPRADYTPGQLPALPVPLQLTDAVVVWRNSAGQTFQVPASAFTALIAGSTAPQEKPAGRLTLTTGQPVMQADVNNAGIVLYTPYVGNLVPIFNGATWVMTPFVETALTLNAAFNTANNVYDVFGFINAAGTFALVAGPAWTTPASARGTGAGTTQIQQQNGLWVNSVTITGNNGAAQTVVAALTGTYLGSFFANGNAQCTMNFKPAAAAGGSANILGLYNAYNRVYTKSEERDSTLNVNYNVAAWRNANASASNRVTFVDGLQQSRISSWYCANIAVTCNNNTASGSVGALLDTTGSAPVTQAVTSVQNSGSIVAENTVTASDTFNPQLGLHFLQASEFGSSTGTTTFNASPAQPLIIALEM